ncbi:MAG: hypothetical protein GX178_04385 [Acidobacteria bacterium]|jgi:hypothetical protein|nr:hypothetical protein [Thermoanaerobaculia bacterium]MDI9630230.1 hypothetical protein [Acidobacteriota bacterium]OQC40133.1 MAG: hypothetical protein BWX64_01523 [Acidobacteria bacterium ADurb.Bin051]MBP7812100.1 hypothetical protein [Thermoanaerobaculia bacterium]MBP8844595.1 hypothetical protein [Thermoanaerobaculia bacterium]
MNQVESERARVEASLTALREKVESEWGHWPRATPWLLALAAGAIGFALGLRRPRRRSFRRLSGA